MRLLSPKLVTFAALMAIVVSAQAKTTIDDHHLDNREVGFYGFRVDIPFDYQVYTPPKDKKQKLGTFADFAWNNAKRLDGGAGFSTTEIIPFKAYNRGLMVVVTTSAASFPPVKQEKEYLRVLDIFTSWVLPRSDQDFLRDVRKVGAAYVGRVGQIDKKGNVSVANVVLIPPRTILTFYGCCPELLKDEILADLDATIATLDIGKPKKD